MQAISPERTSFQQSAAVTLVTFAALVLLGLVLAYWTWAWFAPRPEPRAQAAGGAVGLSQAAYGLFGSARRDSGTAPAGIPLRLLGVVAAEGGRPDASSGYAVFRLDAKQAIAVREGGEIEPGVRLAEVHADHVVLERSGVRETLAWPKQGKPAAAAAAAPRASN